MLVGETPGEEGGRLGRPFVGRSERLLLAVLGEMGVDRSRVYLTTVIKRRLPGNRLPTPREIRAGLVGLRKEVRAVGPRVVVALGTLPAHALLQTREPLSRLLGRAFRNDGRRVYVTYHPAYIMRNASRRTVFKRHLRAALAYAGMP